MTEPSAADGPSVVRLVWEILTPRDRRNLLSLVPAVVVMALLETAGVASIVPFLGLLSDATRIEKQQILGWLYTELGFRSHERFFFAVGLSVLLVITVGNLVSALTTRALLRFSWMQNHTLSARLLRDYLRRPYAYFLMRNTADLSKNMLGEVYAVVMGVMVNGVQLIARLTVVAFLSMGLFWLDPFMALGTGVAFGGVYGAIFLRTRRSIVESGKARVGANEGRYKLAAEAFGAIKEVKLYGLERVVEEYYAKPSLAFATTQARNQILASLPRFALETIAFGGVLAIVLYLLSAGKSLVDVLPVLGLYAFAAFRLLPGLQTVFSGLTMIRFNYPALRVLNRDMAHREPDPEPIGRPEVSFQREVRLNEVRFSYPTSEKLALAEVSLTLQAGEWIALVGSTGSGKSTLVDLLLGLLEPTGGEITVDGAALDASGRKSWQAAVAYVPQQIFLIDDTIRRNICFAVMDEEIDETRLRWAAKIAQIDEFISSELPKGYATKIGERGIRLSGGQRQRIGIARALYRRPRLLVLDEATSALDHETEQNFFNALKAGLGSVTVVSIAHRLTTTRAMDRIYLVDAGVVSLLGSFSDAVERSPFFASVKTQIVTGPPLNA